MSNTSPPAPLVWSRKKPDATGSWHWRQNLTKTIILCDVLTGGRVIAWLNGMELEAASLLGEFAGPIPDPLENPLPLNAQEE